MKNPRRKQRWLVWLLLGILCMAINYALLRRLPLPEAATVKWMLCLLLLEGMGLWYLISDPRYYRADMIEITPDIQTPAPAGQGQYGTARWLKKDEYSRVFANVVLNRGQGHVSSGGLVVGKEDLGGDKEKVFYVKDFVHTLTLGATRSGKTRNEVLQTIGLCGLAGESLVMTDIKGELYDYTAPFLREQGYEVWVLDYDEMELSNAYNPLQPVIDRLDADDLPGAMDACWDIVSQLVGEPKGEPIWNNGECSTIAAGIMAVCYDNRAPENHKYRNLSNVYSFLQEMLTPIGPFVPFNLYRAMLPEHHPVRGMLAVAEVAPEQTKGSFYTAALTTLRLFINQSLYSMTKSSDFDPKDFGVRKSALFLILPEDRKTYHPIATLLVSQIYSQLSRQAKQMGGTLPIVVNFICDEFGNFAKIPNFSQMLTVAGGKGIRFHLFLQDYAQLDDVYGQDAAKTIRGNCEIKVYLRSADPETREIISKDLNNYTTKGYSLNYGRRDRETSSSVQLVGRPLLDAGEVGRIKRPWSLVMSSDYPAILYAPDVSCWSFNDLFGMGDREHNVRLRMERHAARTGHRIQEIELWGVWNRYQEQCRMAADAMK